MLQTGELFLAENSRIWNPDGTKKEGVTQTKGRGTGFDNVSYLDLLENRAIPSIKERIEHFVFMHDNAKPHTKKEHKNDDLNLAQKLLGEFGIELVDWPAYSCDLNPQENVWSMLDTVKNNIVFIHLFRVEATR